MGNSWTCTVCRKTITRSDGINKMRCGHLYCSACVCYDEFGDRIDDVCNVCKLDRYHWISMDGNTDDGVIKNTLLLLSKMAKLAPVSVGAYNMNVSRQAQIV
jgi:hypothetical protein